MSHPSDRRSDGPADRRVERTPDRSADRSAQRRPEGRGGSAGEGRPGERRRAGPQDRSFGAGGASRWGSAAWRGRRPGAASGEERPTGPGARDGGRFDRPGTATGVRRIFRDGPRRTSRGDFGGAGERGGSFAERRGSFSPRRGNFAERRDGPRDRGVPERPPGGERPGERGPGDREGSERRGGEWRGSGRGAGGERGGDWVSGARGSGERGSGERGRGDRGGGERPGGVGGGAGVRWPGASPGRFPGSRRPDRPARPRLPLRLQPGRPSLFSAPAAAAATPVEVEAESHAPAAPADLIWGRHSALAALEAGRPLHRIWCTSELRFSPKFLQLLREAKASGVLLEEVTWARLGQISGGAVHQGIVLQPAAAATLQLDSLIEGCRQLGESPLLIAVDGLTDPQNLGAIVRSAEALGAHGLVLPQRRNAGLTGSVAKVAAGALEHLPVARVVNLNRSLDALKQEGYRVIGLAAEGTVTLEEADLSGPLVLVTGSEAEGLSLLTRRGCDQLVRIPLRGTTPSLNASVATALLLYEVARRSWMAGLRGTAPAPRLERPSLPVLEQAASQPELDLAQPEPETVSVGAEAHPAEVRERSAPMAPDSPVDSASPAPSSPPSEGEDDFANDAGTPIDAGIAMDAGTPMDAEIANDAGTPIDAGIAVDVGIATEEETATEGRRAEAEPLESPSGAPQRDLLAADAPPVEAPPVEMPSVEAPSVEAPSSAALSSAALSSEAPSSAEASAAEASAAAASAAAASADEPCGEAPSAEASSSEPPSSEPPSSEAPSVEATAAEALASKALTPAASSDGSLFGEADPPAAGVADCRDPVLQRDVPATSTPSLVGAEATAAATALAEPFTGALVSPGAGPAPSALSTAPGPAGQEVTAGTTPEVAPAFDQDVSL